MPLKCRALDHINMNVRSLEDSLRFYREVFGFDLKEDHRDDPDEPWMIIGRPGVGYLCQYECPHAVKAEDHLTLNHFGFALDDYEGALDQLEAMGVEVLYGGHVDWPHSRSIYIKDPSGYVIELAEHFGGGLDDH